ncbi:MAG TPA: 3' terminal RNA ribose 2'-O-methyltransferase Hen1 [Gammaproteobacteria bacterium]
MLLTITTTHQPASDLGYLLHKHPDKHQVFDLSFGRAHVFYPEVGGEKCTAALMLDIDPHELVQSFRGRGGPRMIEHYINDRPYVVSSFMSVALAKVFGTAMSGRSKGRQELSDCEIPLEFNMTALPARGGAGLLRDLFEPLGYEVIAQAYPLDPAYPEWGDSHYFDVALKTKARLRDALSHLYVLIPVLDKDKHYWVGVDEVEKLLKRGEGWLKAHPKRELITARYLKFQSSLTKMAEAALIPDEEVVDTEESGESGEEQFEKPLNLNELRYGKVLDVLKAHNAKRVVDLGCGEGRLLKRLLNERTFDEIVGVDVSSRALDYAGQRLRLDQLPDKQRERIKLLHGSLIYRDSRIRGYDAAVCVEVVEHLEPDRLDAFEKVLFGYTRPGLVIITTPNREYNARFGNMEPGKFRHPDHRFEWTRREFREWATGVAERNDYCKVEFSSIGEEDEVLGAPTQMAAFEFKKPAF